MNNIKSEKIIQELKAQIDKHDIISFDIFDTLLLRPYTKPEHIFYHLERINNEDNFSPKRMYANNIAYNSNPQCEEITFDQIYNILGKRYHYLKQQELDLEESVLTANIEMQEVYNYAKAQGKRIIISSDMYLPIDFIEKLLKKNGYDDYFKIYLSSDLKKTKRSGNLYKYILQDLNAKAQSILHIGDNRQSDVEMPMSMGISTFYYEKVMTRFLIHNPKAAVFFEKNQANLGASIILGISAIKSLECTGDYWQNLGYSYAGPLAYAYTNWLCERVKERGIKEILFIARDGYTLQKIFEMFKDDDMKTHYFYAPRLFLSAIQLNPTSKVNVEVMTLSSTKFILDYYKDKHPFLKENTPDITTSHQGIAFINANFPIYNQLVMKEAKNFMDYITAEKIQGEDVALVDMTSFSLSSQKLVTSFMANHNIYAYYWWYLKQTSYENPQFNCENFQIGERVMGNLPFMEFLITAPEAPAQGFEDGKVLYKQDLSEDEKLRIELYPQVFKGAMEFAQDVQKYFGTRKTLISSKNIVDINTILGEYPDEVDKQMFAQIKTGVDPNHSSYSQLFPNWYQQGAKV